jgi:hypothetical protein
MAFHRDAPFIAQAIRSVLDQTFTDFELMMINDASPDGSREIAAHFDDPRIRIVDNDTNVGLTRSLNRGLSMIHSELVARLDANDVCFPERLAKQVAYLDAHPGVAVVGVQATAIDVNGRRIRRAETRRPTTAAGLRWYSIFDTPLIHPGTMYRRTVVWDELGGYDERFRVGQDAELWLRVARRHHIANLGERLMALRSDPRSISGDLTLAVRQGHVERWVPIIHANMREQLQWDDLPRRWAELWVEVNHPGTPSSPPDLREFIEVVERCRGRFAEVEPESKHATEIDEHQAFMLSRALWKAAATSRLLSIRLWFLMLLHPSTAVRALPKYVVLFVLGQSGLRICHIFQRWFFARKHVSI